MAESKKETSSLGQPKKRKNSLLDLDFDKDDFLSSWKTSLTDDDAMDLDFGPPISEGKKKAFKFEKSDIDFSLDTDFGKIPSFNLDIPDIDISSPVKKDGKPKERSREESTVGNTKGKADLFDFTFDFNDFKSMSKQENVTGKGGKDKEDSSSRMLSQKSRECPAEDVDTHQSESRNPPATGSLITSKPDLQGSARCSPESSYVNSPTKSAKDVVDQLNSLTSIDEEKSDKKMTLVKKKGSGGNSQELNLQQDQSIFPKLLPQDVCIENENKNVQDKLVHSALRNESSPDTVPETREEVTFGDTEACNLEISGNKKPKADHGEIPVWSSSGNDTASVEKKKAGSQDQTHNDALVAVKEGAEPVQSATQVEKLLSAHASTDLVPKVQVNVKNQGEQLLRTLNSKTAASTLMPEKEREFVTRSKYFKQPDNAESQFQNASDLATCSSTSDREIGARQLLPADGSRKHNYMAGESDTNLSGISLSHSGYVIGKENSQIRSWESCRELKTNRSRSLDEDAMKGKQVVSTGGDKDDKNLRSFGSYSNSSSLSGLKIKSSSQNSENSAGLAMNVESCHNGKSNAGAGDKLSSVKAIKKMPSFSSLTSSRASVANLDSSKSSAPKDTTLARDVQQHRNLAGSTLSKSVEVAVPQKQMLTAPSLKRKMDEADSTDLMLKPLKWPSESPGISKSTETSRKLVNSKGCENENGTDEKRKNACKNQNNSNHNVTNHMGMNELEDPSPLDYDSNIEMAEACSKGLEDNMYLLQICNLLSKKHEEAKELLVRAVVNNNRLLMLNHPIYEEKVRMVQKFAAQLTLREIHS